MFIPFFEIIFVMAASIPSFWDPTSISITPRFKFLAIFFKRVPAGKTLLKILKRSSSF